MILLIRHAEAIWTEAGADSIVRDPELTENGRRQASLLAEALLPQSIDVLVSSPLRRAASTFDIVAGRLGRRTAHQSWLREIRYPDWRGWTLGAVQAILRDYDREDVAKRWDGLAGGESARDHIACVRQGAEEFLGDQGLVRSRTDDALWEMADQGKNIAMIGHVGSLASVASLLLGMPRVAWERQRFQVPHASVTRLTTVEVGDKVAFGLTALGDVSFLPAALRTG
jgi:broad specificity phosphatase PhoE